MELENSSNDRKEIMASKKHDNILTFVAGKMQNLGYTLNYYEGNYVNVTMKVLNLPPKLINHRPDVIGSKKNGAICIGEAKTETDLTSKRTKTQMIDFKKIISENPENLLIIGLPIGTKKYFLTVLSSIGITLDEQIEVIEIPKQFLY